MIAWHYTTGTKFKLIQESGVLLPADIGTAPNERPILWFSCALRYEKSALKGIRTEDGRVRQSTLEELYEMGYGLYRFGCPISRLQHGEVLRKSAKMQSIVWRKLAKKALAMGANPGDWWGYVGEMDLAELTVEAMDEQMKWRPLTEMQAKAAVEAIAAAEAAEEAEEPA